MNDFSPACFALVLICSVIFIILIGIGLGIAAILAACASLLVTLGIISSSALIGFSRGRILSAIRAFHYQILAAISIPCGIALLWTGAALYNLHISHRQIFAIGALAGLAAGLLLAFSFDHLARLAYRRFVVPVISRQPISLS